MGYAASFGSYASSTCAAKGPACQPEQVIFIKPLIIRMLVDDVVLIFTGHCGSQDTGNK